MDTVLDVETTAEEVVAPEVPRPIFFMHIAKTAGSYLNARFIDALGKDRAMAHIEATVGNRADLKGRLDAGVRYFSGHVMYPLWRDIAGPLQSQFCKVTILRDPIAHIASHIQWLDHYNLPTFSREYRFLDEHHRRLVDQIGGIDITEVGQLDAFLSGLSGVGVRLLDNCQARYFVTAGRQSMDAIRPLTLADRFNVARAAGEFDVIAFQDDLQTGLDKLSEATGVPLVASKARVNPAVSSRKIDTANPLVRQVLSRRTLVDQWLFHHLRSRQNGDS